MYCSLKTSFSLFSELRIIQLTAFAIKPVNQTSIRVLIRLNSVWSIDSPYRAAVPSGDVGSETLKPSAAGLGNPKTVLGREKKL